MNKCSCLYMGLLAGMVMGQTLAATSWDFDNNRRPRSAMTGIARSGHEGKDESLTQRALPPKPSSEEATSQEGFRTTQSSALTSVVSSLSGTISEVDHQKNITPVPEAHSFKVCCPEELSSGAGIATVILDTRAKAAGRIAIGGGNENYLDSRVSTKPHFVSVNEDLKRFFGAGKEISLRASILGKSFDLKAAAKNLQASSR